MRTCDVCGQPLPVQTGRGGRRKRHPECRGKRPAPAVTASTAEPTVSTVALVDAEVAALNVADKPEAQAAREIAARIDAGQEPGAALASLSKELRTLLAGLRSTSAPAAADPVDELKARRASRTGT